MFVLDNLRVNLRSPLCGAKTTCTFLCSGAGNGAWNNIQLTYENNNIDYYIIINSPVLHDSNELQYHNPRKSIIWIVEHKESWWRKEYKYDKFLQDKNYLMHLTFENSLNWGQFHIGLSYNELMHNNVCKNKILSSVTSSSN